MVANLRSEPPEACVGELFTFCEDFAQFYEPHPLGQFPDYMSPAGSRQLTALEEVLTLAFGRASEQAIALLQRLADTTLGGWQPPVLLGHWQLELGRYDEALRSAHQALAIHSNSLHALSLIRDTHLAWRAAGRSGADSISNPETRREAEIFLRDNADRFCRIPFTELITTESGDVNTCCAALHPVVIGNLYAQSWEEVWNSPAAQEARRSILDGDYRYCNRAQCPYLQSNSLPKKTEIDDPVLRDIIDHHKTRLDTPPTVASLGHDASCNLSCPQCRTGLIVAKGGSIDKLKRANDDFVLPLTRSTAEIIVTNSGDPFASKHFREFLRAISPATHPHLKKLTLLTNGLLWTPKEWASFSNIHYLDIMAVVSVNAARADTFREIRRRGDFARLMPNLEFISRLRRERRIGQYHLRFAVQARNFEEMPEFVRLGIELGVNTIVFTKLMNLGTYGPDEFRTRDISSPDHPRHVEFLYVLRDPLLEWENIVWDNLEGIRRSLGLSDAAASNLLRGSALELFPGSGSVEFGPIWRLERLSRLNGSLRAGGLPSARQPRLVLEATELAGQAEGGPELGGDLIVEDMSTGRHRFEIVVRDPMPSGLYTFSFSLRAHGRSLIQLETRDGDSTNYGFARFDLAKGTVLTVFGGVTAPRIEEEERGWYRVSTTLPYSNDPMVASISLLDEREEFSYAGDGRPGIVVRRFVLESAERPLSATRPAAGAKLVARA